MYLEFLVYITKSFIAVSRKQGSIHILARHEQGAGFMADGYARLVENQALSMSLLGRYL